MPRRHRFDAKKYNLSVERRKETQEEDISSHQCADLACLRMHLDRVALPQAWTMHNPTVEGFLVFTKMSFDKHVLSASIPLLVKVDEELRWSISCHGSLIDVNQSEVLSVLPSKLTSISAVNNLFSALQDIAVCQGNRADEFRQLINTQDTMFMGSTASLDSKSNSIRHVACERLIPASNKRVRCKQCISLRGVLRVKSSRLLNRSSNRTCSSSTTPYYSLSRDEMQLRMSNLHSELRRIQKQRDRMKEQLDNVLEKSGVAVSEEVNDDLKAIIESEGQKATEREDCTYFQKIFWQQQVSASTKHDARGMRWHPMMIKWCIFLRAQSQGAYETLRDSGCIKMPSQRTLRDYTHHLKSGPGYSAGVDLQLHSAAKLNKCEEMDRFVMLLLDEMYIKQDLVYDKNSGELVGFTNLGDINNHFLELERSMSACTATSTSTKAAAGSTTSQTTLASNISSSIPACVRGSTSLPLSARVATLALSAPAGIQASHRASTSTATSSIPTSMQASTSTPSIPAGIRVSILTPSATVSTGVRVSTSTPSILAGTSRPIPTSTTTKSIPTCISSSTLTPVPAGIQTSSTHPVSTTPTSIKTSIYTPSIPAGVRISILTPCNRKSQCNPASSAGVQPTQTTSLTAQTQRSTHTIIQNLGISTPGPSSTATSTSAPSISAEPLAQTMMVFMVKGLFSQLEFPYVHFPCHRLTGDLIYEPFWNAVHRLERLGFKVMGATFDGASVNRKLVKLHSSEGQLVNEVFNPFSIDQRPFFFIFDPPHLIKTTRNCWASKARMLWNNGKDIKWSHLWNIYFNRSDTGLTLLPKLKFEHISLTSFSKMRVDLAAQVLSYSVSKCLTNSLGARAEGTSIFTDMFDKFFDAVNVSNFDSGKLERKQFKDPYRSSSDFRLRWLEETFLPYLDKWEDSVWARDGFTDGEKRRMLLSQETLSAIRITTKSFLGLVRYLFNIQGVKYFLSRRICQDPLEKYFGMQRQIGGTHNNPTAEEFQKNTQALRVVNSFCKEVVRGNCRGNKKKGKRKIKEVDIENCNEPLPKRFKSRSKHC